MVTKKEAAQFRYNFKGASYIFPPYKEMPFKALKLLFASAQIHDSKGDMEEWANTLFQGLTKLEEWNEDISKFTDKASLEEIQVMLQKWSAHSGNPEELKK